MDVRLPDEESAMSATSSWSTIRRCAASTTCAARRSGRTRYVELHLLVDPAKTIQEVHNLCDHLEADILERLPSAVITIAHRARRRSRAGAAERNPRHVTRGGRPLVSVWFLAAIAELWRPRYEGLHLVR